MQLTPAPDGTGWFLRLRTRRTPRLRLYCFPHAGGGVASFVSWSQWLPDGVELRLVQYPGRERRLREPPLTRMAPLVSALADALAADGDDGPFAFFGYSLGGLVGFELGRELAMRSSRGPVHLFVAASPAPHLHDRPRPIHQLADDQFKEELIRLQGTPREVLANDELMELVMPGLRADFEIVDRFEYVKRPPLACSVTAFGGTNDPEVSREQLEGWRQHTGRAFVLRMYPGGHFFFESARVAALRDLAADLEILLGSSV